MNPKDPMLKASADGQRELFNRFTQAANGFSTEQAAGAAANVIVNALRQVYGKGTDAEMAFDELFGRMKTLLTDHYDSLGRKRGIFPFHQTIEAQMVRGKTRLNGGG